MTSVLAAEQIIKNITNDIHSDNSDRLLSALDNVNRLLDDYPDNAGLWILLGNVLEKKGYYTVAMSCFKKGLNDPEHKLAAYNNMGLCLSRLGEYNQARGYFDYVVKHDKDTYSLANLAVSLCYGYDIDKAITLALEALKLNPHNRYAKLALHHAYLHKGDYKKGFYYGDARKQMASESHQRNFDAEKSIPLWREETPPKDKTLIVYGEQGLGDEILYGQLIARLKENGNRIIFECENRLVNLWRNSYLKNHDIPIHGTRQEKELLWPVLYDIDYKILLGSLAKLYWHNEKDIEGGTYLTANPSYLPKSLPPKKAPLRIGFAWRGGTKQTCLNERIIPLKLFAPLFDLDAEFISFQYDANSSHEIEKFIKKNPQYANKITHNMDWALDMDVSAAILGTCDVLISVPQTILHLAGALGVPGYQLCPLYGMWQQGVVGQDMPWHKSIKNIWQDRPGEWENVIDKVVENVVNQQKLLTAESKTA